MKNSAASPRSEGQTQPGEVVLVVVGLCGLAAIAVCWFYSRGYILYYGDAQAHINLSRSILDSRTPGYDQLGSVWLPLLHVICLPFVRNNRLWSTGLAGSIPVSVCFVVAGLCFYLAAKEAYQSSLTAAAVLCCFALNPNILYLASIPMTEIVFFAGLAITLLSLLRFQSTQRRCWIGVAVLASWAMSLTRYDGWFLIPFAAAWFAAFARTRRRAILVIFGLLATLAPLYWLAHCWWETGNALDFYNGPYSAKSIQGGRPYPGYHDWRLAFLYYAEAAQLCSGWCLILLGLIGIACAAVTQSVSKLGFLSLTPLFYIWSIHSSGNPIFVPQLYQGYYNTRYGLAVVALAAFAAGAFVRLIAVKRRKLAFIVPLISVLPWLVRPGPNSWICWKESQVNSLARRAWTQAGASYLQSNYDAGQGVLAPFGDLTGIFCKAGIPIAEVLHEGNRPAWEANSTRPDLIHQQSLAIAQEGSRLSEKLEAVGSAYRLAYRFDVPKGPALLIFKRIP